MGSEVVYSGEFLMRKKEGKRNKKLLARHASYNRAPPKPKKILCEIERRREKNRHFSTAFRWSAVVRTVPS